MFLELQNPKVWIIAVGAGLIGMLFHFNSIRWWAFIRYAVLTVAVKVAMPLFFNKATDTHVYFIYGLTFGSIAGLLNVKANTTSRWDDQPKTAQHTSIEERLTSVALGASIGVVVNIAIATLTYV